MITYLFVQEFKISGTLILSIGFIFWLAFIIPSSIITGPLIVFVIIIGITIYWVVILQGLLTVFKSLAKVHIKDKLKLTLGSCWESLEQSNDTLIILACRNYPQIR